MNALRPELLPFAPLLYVAWADGALTAREIAHIRAQANEDARLDAETRHALAAWLDPDAPPAAAALNDVLETIRAHAHDLPRDARKSLAELGHALAKAAEPDAELSPPARAAVEDLEAAIGIVSDEAIRSLLPERREAVEPVRARAFAPAAMHRFLDRDHFEVRTRVLTLLATSEFAYFEGTDHHAYRQRVFAWCRRLADEGVGAIAYPREFGGTHDVAGFIAAFETLAFHDLSLFVKFGVQFGLFAGSIYQLGTRLHHERYLAPALRLELPGCFAMTETGHGSNVRGIETTATYDRASGEFVIRTPTPSARKDYIGNAGLHGRMATVFAQLRTRGESHGVHAFLVPIRDTAGQPMPGVHIEDCGPKAGLNGVDNGRLAFEDVKVPRDHLLDRFGRVMEDGTYTSPIASPARRFFTMIGTLVGGRISIAAGALNATKSALTIAVRYASRRRQFGPEGEPEIPILEYLDLQHRLLPRLATTYALDFAIKDLVQRFATASATAAREVEAHAAGLKAFSARHAVETLQACREACGGQGYLAVNRLPALKADTDVFTTFEGADPVLLQLVARALLTGHREDFEELRLWGAVRYVAAKAAVAITELNPIITRRTDAAHLRDPEFHTAAFRYREDRLLSSLARRLRHRIEQGQDSFAALNACQDHAIALADAHVQRIVLEQFQAGLAACPDRTLVPFLSQLAVLFALWHIHSGRGWFLEKGYLEPGKVRAIHEQINVLCSEIRTYAVDLVDGFGIPDAVISAPIADGG